MSSTSSTSSGEERTAMKIKKKNVEQITLGLFQNCDVPEEVSGIFYQEVDLIDHWWISPRARIYFLCSPIMRQKIEVFEDVCESPVERCAFSETFACEDEPANSRTHFKEYPEVFQNS